MSHSCPPVLAVNRSRREARLAQRNDDGTGTRHLQLEPESQSLNQKELNRCHLRPEFATEPLSSFRTICPPFMTNFTRSSSVTSFAGLPETPTKSANLPFSMDPTRSFQPIFSAPTEVAERIVCRGVMPYSTMSANSTASSP